MLRASAKSPNFLIDSGRRLMAIGDSNVQRNMIGSLTGTNGYNSAYRAIGFISWMNVLLNNPFSHVSYFRGSNSFNRGDNKGISGDTTEGVLARLGRDIIAEKPTDVLVYIGANDIAQGTNKDVILNNIITICERIMRVNANIILCTIAPRNHIVGSGYSAAADLDRLYINGKLTNFANSYRGKISLVDLSAIGVYNVDRYILPANYTNDGVHLNKLGALTAFNSYLKPVIASILGPLPMPRNIPGAYDGTLALYGNILTNPDYTGTAGTLGSGITGTVPDSWRSLRSGTGPSSVASVVSTTDWNGTTRNFIQHVISSAAGGAAGDYVDTRHYAAASDLFTTGSVLGEWYTGEVEMIVDPVSSGANILNEIALRIVDTDGDDSYSSCFYVNDVTYPTEKMPDGSFRLILRTPPLQCRGTTGFNFSVRAYIDGTATGSRTIRFGAPVFRRIPRVALELIRMKNSGVFSLGAASFIAIPPRFLLENIVIENTTANAITGGLKFGTTVGGADIVSAIAVGANANVSTKPSDLLSVPVSLTNSQLICVDAVTAWNSASVNIYLIGKEI